MQHTVLLQEHLTGALVKAFMPKERLNVACIIIRTFTTANMNRTSDIPLLDIVPFLLQDKTRPRGYKTFFMLSSSEHDIETAH